MNDGRWWKFHCFDINLVVREIVKWANEKTNLSKRGKVHQALFYFSYNDDVLYVRSAYESQPPYNLYVKRNKNMFVKKKKMMPTEFTNPDKLIGLIDKVSVNFLLLSFVINVAIFSQF